MPTGRDLLKQAYALVEAGKVDSALKLLDQIVKQEPGLVETWELYLQISPSIPQMDKIAQRISACKEIDPRDKKDILEYYRYLVRTKEGKPFAPAQHEDNRFVLYVIPAVFILILILLWVRKLILDNSQYQNWGMVLNCLAVLGAIYFLRIIYKQMGSAKRQATRSYAKSVDRIKLISRNKRLRKK